MYSMNIKTCNFLKHLFLFLSIHTHLQPVILHTVSKHLLFTVNRLLWFICISEIQFDISKTFSNTLNIHLCHPHIYPKLQKTTYQVLLTTLWHYNSKPIPTVPPQISINHTILYSPSPTRKLQTVGFSWISLSHTHTHSLTPLDLKITVLCTQKCLVSDWLLFMGVVKLKDQWTDISPLCENTFYMGHS